jgi:hypothetical protein
VIVEQTDHTTAIPFGLRAAIILLSVPIEGLTTQPINARPPDTSEAKCVPMAIRP